MSTDAQSPFTQPPPNPEGWTTQEPTWETSRPLDGRTHAKLLVTGGVSNSVIAGAAPEGELYRGRFVGLIPAIDVEGDLVHLRHDFGVTDWLRFLLTQTPQSARLELSRKIPWAVELRGGVSRLSADLRDLELTLLEMRGGVSLVSIALPRPKGRIALRASGGANKVTLHRPKGCAFSVAISGGVSRLRLDENEFGAIGGPCRWQSPGDADSSDGYELVIHGGVHELSVTSEELPSDAASHPWPIATNRAPRWGGGWRHF